MASDSSSLVQEVCSELRLRNQTIAFAESCTGGLLSGSFTALAGVSDVYLGSVVAYSNRVKEEMLGVSYSLIKTMGAVSTPVAKQMARGVCDTLHSDWGVSITGIAGPGGGTVQKPVGTVCFGISGPGFEGEEQRLFIGDRRGIQEASVTCALQSILKAIRA